MQQIWATKQWNIFRNYTCMYTGLCWITMVDHCIPGTNRGKAFSWMAQIFFAYWCSNIFCFVSFVHQQNIPTANIILLDTRGDQWSMIIACQLSWFSLVNQCQPFHVNIRFGYKSEPWYLKRSVTDLRSKSSLPAFLMLNINAPFCGGEKNLQGAKNAGSQKTVGPPIFIQSSPQLFSTSVSHSSPVSLFFSFR